MTAETGETPVRQAENIPFPPDRDEAHTYILIDTNGFMIPVRFHVDIFGELKRLGYNRFVVPSPVIRELKGLCRKKSGVDKTAARVALSMAEKCHVAACRGYADDILLELAVQNNVAVLTNDAALRDRLLEKRVKVITLRQKTHLEPVT